MRFVIFCFFLFGVSGPTCVVKAQAVECVYKDSWYAIGQINLNITHYTCLLDTSRINYGAKPASIVGDHQKGKTDDDVKFVQNYYNQKLQTLTSIFCDNFKNLEVIWIHAKLEFVDENAFWKCENLKHLTLSENNFHRLPANLLVENGKLQTIFIVENSQLSPLPENFFANQNQLEYLILHTNNLSSLPSGIFKQLTKLKGKLQLDDNNLEVIDPKWFESLCNLDGLNIERNKLTEVPRKCFQSMRNLKKLWIGINKISTLHPDSFFGLDNLELLSISNNQLTDLPSGVLAGLKKLEQLLLTSNKLTTVHSDSIGSLPKLWQITLEGNKINSIDEKIVDSTALKWINMTNNICYDGLIEFDRYAIKFLLQTCFSNYRPRPENTQLSTGSCGRSAKTRGTIIGGTFISQGEFPWLAILISVRERKYFCGGVLVSNRKVVTAAHCMMNKRATEVRQVGSFIVSLGTHDLDNHFDPERINYAVERVIPHPDWNPNIDKWDADIAVLYLNRDVTFTPFIQPICLIPKGSPAELIKEGTAVGYGKSEDESKKHENIAKSLDMPIVKPFDCLDKFPDWAGLTSLRTFCAGSADGIGTCKGDSGSGLYVKYGNIFYLRGIVSASLFTFGRDCDVNSLSLFTDVPQFNDWIESVNRSEYLLDKK